MAARIDRAKVMVFLVDDPSSQAIFVEIIIDNKEIRPIRIDVRLSPKFLENSIKFQISPTLFFFSCHAG